MAASKKLHWIRRNKVRCSKEVARLKLVSTTKTLLSDGFPQWPYHVRSPEKRLSFRQTNSPRT